MGYSQTQQMENERKLPTKLQLPQRYSDLIQFQSFVDCSMNILHKNGEVFMFEEISRMVSAQSGKKFTMDHFKQILYIEPNFYNFKWYKNGQLKISVPENIR